MTSNLPTDEVVGVRALLPEDRQRLRAMFSRVSSETIYRRFHTPYPSVPEWMPEFLIDADARGGRSLVAVVGEEIVGHAMCSRPEAGEAEVAIVVEDRWQSRGVGKLLLSELAEDAKGRGVEAFVCIFLVENRVVPRLVDSVFSDARYSLREGTRLTHAALASLRSLRAPTDFDESHKGVADAGFRPLGEVSGELASGQGVATILLTDGSACVLLAGDAEVRSRSPREWFVHEVLNGHQRSETTHTLSCASALC